MEEKEFYEVPGIDEEGKETTFKVMKSKPRERVFATSDQVLAVLMIAKDNLFAKNDDKAYRKGVNDLIKETSRWLGKCQSRWLYGYIDGLNAALKILEETYGKKEDLRNE